MIARAAQRPSCLRSGKRSRGRSWWPARGMAFRHGQLLLVGHDVVLGRAGGTAAAERHGSRHPRRSSGSRSRSLRRRAGVSPVVAEARQRRLETPATRAGCGGFETGLRPSSTSEKTRWSRRRASVSPVVAEARQRPLETPATRAGCGGFKTGLRPSSTSEKTRWSRRRAGAVSKPRRGASAAEVSRQDFVLPQPAQRVRAAPTGQLPSAVDLFVVVFLAGDFLAVDFLVGVVPAVVFFAVVFFVVVFLAGDFLAVDFLVGVVPAVVFFAATSSRSSSSPATSSRSTSWLASSPPSPSWPSPSSPATSQGSSSQRREVPPSLRPAPRRSVRGGWAGSPGSPSWCSSHPGSLRSPCPGPAAAAPGDRRRHSSGWRRG